MKKNSKLCQNINKTIALTPIKKNLYPYRFDFHLTVEISHKNC